jgi:ATP-dependent exoDNAse (exonuclease V) beta subunit
VRDGAPVGPSVAIIGRDEHPRGTGAEAMREAEAADVVAAIQRAMAERWSVDMGTGWRGPQLGDIAVLLPARTSLPYLEDALDRAGIAYRTESSSLVYASRAVRDLLMTARAIDDPTDHLAVAAALRSPLFGCGDDDLYRFRRERGGWWDSTRPQPDTVPVDDPVRVGIEWLGDMHKNRRPWRAPSEVLEQIARDRRMFELGFAEGRPRDLWRRLRFVIDQARAWHEATSGSLRQYLRWVDHQRREGARVAEAVLPETDDDAVRILTIHAAKGLEFPITIVSGLSTRPGGRSKPAEVVFPPGGGVGYKFGRHVKTQEFDDFKPIDEQMAYDERLRLLYVACTRARDHLVVSLHRVERATEPDVQARTNAEVLVWAMARWLDELPDAAGDAVAEPTLPFAATRPPVLSLADWHALVPPAIAAAARPRTIAATALAPDGAPRAAEDDPGLDKRPRDLDLPPWIKGRYGSALGRAVHGVLQTIELRTGAGVEAAVAAQAAAEAIVGHEDTIASHVRAALAAPLVQRAAERSHWREVYVGTRFDDDRVLEGYIDLLYRDDDGLVVVDYKTGEAGSADALDARMALYTPQGEAYVRAVADATGEPVARCVFLFLTPTTAIERDLALTTSPSSGG